MNDHNLFFVKKDCSKIATILFLNFERGKKSISASISSFVNSWNFCHVLMVNPTHCINSAKHMHVIIQFDIIRYCQWFDFTFSDVLAHANYTQPAKVYMFFFQR